MSGADETSPRPAILEAYRLWQSGAVADAEALARRILEQSPDHPGALHVLACVARRAGARDRALALIRRGCARPDAPAFLHEERAQLCQELGLLDEAEEAGRSLVSALPSRASAWHHLAITLVMAGKLAEARDALERAVALDPSSGEAHNNLGIVLQRLSEPERALAHYDAAITLAPKNADLHSNRAAVLAALGRHEEALAAAHRAVELRPGLVSARLHGAVIEMERDRLDAALQWIDAIPPDAAETVEVLLVRADILGRLDRAGEAVELCRRAVALRPEDGSAHNLLGVELQTLGRDDEALQAFARAGTLPGRPAIALANQSALLSQLGRAEEARSVVAHALARDPGCAAAWYARATAKRYHGGDPDFAAMEAILAADHGCAHVERMYLHYALGGAYLDAGDGAKAFAHLDAGARMKRALVTYDGAANERWMRAIAAAFPAALVTAHRSGIDSEGPVFVIGMPRSGTTLIEQILGSHPKVFAAGETRHLEQAVARALGSADPQAFPGAFSPAMADGIARDYVARIIELAPPGAARIVDKMMSNIVYAGLIHMMLPRARIILSRRDAVDTCLSCYSKLFSRGQAFSYDLAELGRYFRAQEALAAHWRAVLPSDIFLEVDYESVVADLEHEARRLAAFCGLDWSPACLAFHEARRPVRTASMTQVRQPIYRTSVGRWRQFRAELAPLLQALGQPD